MMKYIFYIFALFFSFSIYSKEEHPYGFYKGVLLLSGTVGNPFAFGGDLTDREKDIQKNLSLRSSLGITPQKLYGASSLPSGIGLPDTNFKNLQSVCSIIFFLSHQETRALKLQRKKADP